MQSQRSSIFDRRSGSGSYRAQDPVAAEEKERSGPLFQAMRDAGAGPNFRSCITCLRPADKNHRNNWINCLDGCHKHGMQHRGEPCPLLREANNEWWLKHTGLNRDAVYGYSRSGPAYHNTRQQRRPDARQYREIDHYEPSCRDHFDAHRYTPGPRHSRQGAHVDNLGTIPSSRRSRSPQPFSSSIAGYRDIRYPTAPTSPRRDREERGRSQHPPPDIQSQPDASRAQGDRYSGIVPPSHEQRNALRGYNSVIDGRQGLDSPRSHIKIENEEDDIGKADKKDGSDGGTSNTLQPSRDTRTGFEQLQSTIFHLGALAISVDQGPYVLDHGLRETTLHLQTMLAQGKRKMTWQEGYKRLFEKDPWRQT